MRFAFFGTPSVARDTLSYLVSCGYTPSVVITSPDAPRGRGQHMTPCDTRVWADTRDIPVMTPARLDDACVQQLREYDCHYALVVAYGKIIPQAILDIFPGRILNVHYSLLPQYRGASPVESALLHGDTTTGVSIQRMVYALDAGDVLSTCTTDITDTETAIELRNRLISLGSELLVDTLPSFLDGTALYIPQDETRVSVTHKISKSDREIHLDADALTNWRTYRAYAEGPGTHFFIKSHGVPMRIKIKSATYDGTMFTPVTVVPEGKTEMPFDEFTKRYT
jgi:methionyl-tRNA formyltransferase